MKAKISRLGVLLGIIIFTLGGVSAVSPFGTSSSAGFSTYASQPDFRTYYSSSDDTGTRLDTYWPVLGDKETCDNRQDFLLKISPAGCQPAVVRSDLLAEQNVPVFCQVDALTLNPLLDIKEIENIRFTGSYPQEIVGTGFHPARAALRTRDTLLGDPLINNIGYVVLVLKKNPVESKLSESVNVTLTANIKYDAGNSLGVGRSTFVLTPMDDATWAVEKNKNSFWQGRYFVRLVEIDDNVATVNIYQGDRKINTLKVKNGETSKAVYAPGTYCRAGVQVAYDGYVAAQDKARLEISDERGTDVIDVYEGSRFLNDRCQVVRMQIDNSTGDTGNVSIKCAGSTFRLELEPRYSDVFVNFETGKEVPINEKDGYIEADFGEQIGKYGLTVSGEVVYVGKPGAAQIIGKKNIISSRKDRTLVWPTLNPSETNDVVKEKAFAVWLDKLERGFKEYQLYRLQNPSESYKLLTEASWGAELDGKFNEAVGALEKVADEFPAEKTGGAEGASTYGEEALLRAIELSGKFGKQNTRVRLIEKFVEKYPNSNLVSRSKLLTDLNEAYRIDVTRAGIPVEIDNRNRNIRLVSLEAAKDKANAEFTFGGEKVSLQIGQRRILAYLNGVERYMEISGVETERVTFKSNCEDVKHTVLKVGEGTTICGSALVLNRVDVKETGMIRLIPTSEGSEIKTNLTVRVGIEKRAVQLSPDKTASMIESLNASIKKWESISSKLGNVVKGMKAACFATSAALTFKSFISGLSGEALARQEVMRGENGWTSRCNDMVARGEKGYTSLNQCYLGEAGNIDGDVEVTKKAIESTNSKISGLEADLRSSGGGMFEDTTVDTQTAKKRLAEAIRSECSDIGDITLANKGLWAENGQDTGSPSVSISNLVSEENVKEATYPELRNIYMNCQRKKLGGMSDGGTSADKALGESAARINQNRIVTAEREKIKDAEARGIPAPIIVGNDAPKLASVVSKSGLSEGFKKPFEGDNSITHVSTVFVDSPKGKFTTGTYLLGLKKTDSGDYTPAKIVKIDGNSVTQEYGGVEEVNSFVGAYKVGQIKALDKVTYDNKYSNPEIRYYENEPYKGMPALVPIDVQRGWYAGTRQTLPTFGGIGAFDSSGKVASFWLCNVGSNGREQFEESNFGDDICQQINLQTGQPLGMFPGLSEREAKSYVDKAVRALDEAARQYGAGVKRVKIAGEVYDVGKPSVGKPGTECQDFMSPSDCHLLFNVCDPVICPSSRCDFGGKYPVADVIQTGIVGSALLCLPNFKEGVYIPVCLTGIQAGIDGWVSILKNHRDCLQESLNTGRSVGICDQLYSIYMCEFFWRQLAPVANVLIPKLIESAYGGGQGARGGGEYLTVMGAWQNMQKSVDYFKNNYAVNSFKAFQVRSIEEAGGEFCKAFISMKGPSAFESLIEPESPPQFHAWFSSTRFSDATVPATAQYKVFYHIFAGKDSGVSYNVYLRGAPETSYYASTPTVQVVSGFIGAGQYASQTKDFTAPEGYKELCVRVNDKEECGFKQVSTSFLVNQLSDGYAADELQKSDIQSERECISGSPSLGAALANTNIQSTVEEVVAPEIYNRGIVRICSTQNPGLSVDPTRFVKVGTCGDSNIGCWLDKKSVENAISDDNVGVKNETLEELKEIQETQLAEGYPNLMSKEDANAEINTIKSAVQRIEAGNATNAEQVQTALQRIDWAYDRVYLNSHKAALLFEKGKILAKLAESSIAGITLIRQTLSVQESEAISNVLASSAKTEGELAMKIVSYSLNNAFKAGGKYTLLMNAKSTGITIDTKGKVNAQSSEVGKLEGYKIVLDSKKKELIKDHFDVLNGAYLTEGKTTLSRETTRYVVSITNVGEALAEASRRTGKYSENKEFVDAIYANNLLTNGEYNEITSGERDMAYLQAILEGKIEGNVDFGAKLMTVSFRAVDSAGKQITLQEGSEIVTNYKVFLDISHRCSKVNVIARDALGDEKFREDNVQNGQLEIKEIFREGAYSIEVNCEEDSEVVESESISLEVLGRFQ